ncbi:hypothetical protein AB0P15_15305 [Streptomyces sp. NPDC087917]|uniref:hypothetical protein n=1 Tax=unclassified Streptomyces TaxID=2593676 RepID=UPI0034293F52
MSATLFAGIARTPDPRTALRRFLALDAVVTTSNGLAYAALPGPLGRFLGIGDGLLLGLGVLLVVYGTAVGLLASRSRPRALPVRLVVAVNAGWTALGLISLPLWLSPTAAALVWIPLQALVVGGFALLQWLSLRAAGSGAQ